MAATDVKQAIAAPSTRQAWLTAYALLWALTLATAATVTAAPGGPALARHLLRLTLTAAHNPPPTIGGVLSIAGNNALRGTWPLLVGLLGVTRRRFTLALADAAVAASQLTTALLVGAALVGYGTRLLPYLPQLPIEFAGLAIGTAGWLMECHTPLSTRRRTALLVLATVVLLCAAGVETTFVPHR